jgi:hypothetical protein
MNPTITNAKYSTGEDGRYATEFRVTWPDGREITLRLAEFARHPDDPDGTRYHRRDRDWRYERLVAEDGSYIEHFGGPFKSWVARNVVQPNLGAALNAIAPAAL